MQNCQIIYFVVSKYLLIVYLYFGTLLSMKIVYEFIQLCMRKKKN